MEPKKLKIEYIDHEGRGVAKDDDKTLFFVHKTAPGDVIRILNVKNSAVTGRNLSLHKRKNNHYLVTEYELLEKSPDRITPECEYFDRCGGCSLMHLPYSKQLAYKENLVKDTLKRIVGLEAGKIREIIGSQEEFFYRNKIRHGFVNVNDEIKIARHAPLSTRKNVPIENCLLFSKSSNFLCEFICKEANKLKLTAFSDKNPTGELKNIILREGKNSKQLMIEIVTARPLSEKNIRLLTKKLIKKYQKRITSLHFSYTAGKMNSKRQRRLIYGTPFIREYLNSGPKSHIVTTRFNISPEAFFQTNTLQAQNIYNTVIKFADLGGEEIVLDLYAGTGTIGIILAPHAKKVFCVEENLQAVKDAKQNISMNKTDNVKMIKGDALREAGRLAKQNIYPDVAVVDPPRAGLSKKSLQMLFDITPFKLVYVSCNLRTFARDLRILQQNNYKIETVQPIDMFPQSHQVECVAKLTL